MNEKTLVDILFKLVDAGLFVWLNGKEASELDASLKDTLTKIKEEDRAPTAEEVAYLDSLIDDSLSSLQKRASEAKEFLKSQ